MFYQRCVGKSLKSEMVIEILEECDIKVEYEFDRLNEGTKDRYILESKGDGFCLIANDDQIIETCFLYLRSIEGYASISLDKIGIEIKEDSLVGFGIPTKSGRNNGINWVRYDSELRSVHYEYDSHGPRLITVMLPSCAPT